jgi:hypothetical protein
MLGPTDPIQRALLAISHCQSLLKSTQENLSSPDREIRQQAGETMRHFGELGKAITSGKSQTPPPDVGADDTSITTLAALLPELNKIADNHSDKNRSKLATKVLNAADVLSMQISKASRSPNRVA